MLSPHFGLVTVWFRSLVSHYAPLASKAKGLMPPRYELRLRALQNPLMYWKMAVSA